MDRRLFLRCMGCSAAAAASSQTGLLPQVLGGVENACAFDLTDRLSSVEARYYKRLAGGGVWAAYQAFLHARRSGGNSEDRQGA